MDPVRNTALSGLRVASTRVVVSANNVVNAQTTAPTTLDATEPPAAAYQPQRVQQAALAYGGVQARAVPVKPGTTTLPDPSSPTGLSAFPNVNLAGEFVDQRLAVNAYKASAALIRTQNELDASLLDAVDRKE